MITAPAPSLGKRRPHRAPRQLRPTRRRPATGPVTITRSISIWVSSACSLVALWFVFFALVLSSLQFQHTQHNLYAQFREQLSQEVAPLGGVITPDAPVALLSMPSMHITDSVIVEGTAAGDLAKGAGHLRDTPLPGQPGTSIIYGRETLFSGVFGNLPQAQAGAELTLTTGQGVFTYRIEQVRHVGDKFPALLADGESRVTFVTAEGARLGNGWTPQHTVYIDAKLQGKSAPAPPGRLQVVPSAEQAMGGDVSALFSLVLWLPLLIMAALATVWSWNRWGRWQTWIVATPVLVAAIWGVTETGIQLLPNLM
jgi:sortase A